jgi:hypothetical protein
MNKDTIQQPPILGGAAGAGALYKLLQQQLRSQYGDPLPGREVSIGNFD